MQLYPRFDIVDGLHQGSLFWLSAPIPYFTQVMLRPFRLLAATKQPTAVARTS
jgi:hypothetical protein